jgi:membrane dipeptidase
MTAAAIHAEALVLDGHADTPQRFADEGWSFSDPIGSGRVNLTTARAGNLAAQFFALWAEPHQWRGRYAFRTLQLLDAVFEQLAAHPATMRLALTPAEVLQAHRDKVFCVLLGLEGGHSIENDLGLLRLYHRLGIRYMTLTWSNSNEWAESSGDLDDPAVPHQQGLTEFGHSVVREMNRLGMMVDVSHASDRTFWDVLQTTRAPVLASHSSARALTASPRNLTDEQLRAVATSNGIVMVNFYPAFIDETWRKAWSATSTQRDALHAAAVAACHDRGLPMTYGQAMQIDRQFYAEHLAATLPLPPLRSLIDHIDHVAQVAGIDHVGLGSDFDGITFLPAGLSSAADLPKITAALHARGYTAPQLHKLLGANLLRVFADTQAVAHPNP